MANTIQTSINWAQAYLGYWNPVVGTNSEPALSAANMVQQVMFAPPFKWYWNRNFNTFTMTPGTQDYVVTIPNFGFMEVATFKNPNTGKILPFHVLNSTPLGESSDLQQPVTLAAQRGSVGNNVNFRCLGLPDLAYTVSVTYQLFVPLMANTSASWTAPDFMSYVYNRGFLAELYEAKGDSGKAQQERMKFAAALLSNAEGLTDTEKNIFLAQYLANDRMMLSQQMKTQQGVQARGT